MDFLSSVHVIYLSPKIYLHNFKMRYHVYQFLSCLALPVLSVALPAQTSASAESIAPELKGKRSLVERDGVKRTIFEHEATGAKLDFVTNSGICETTP